MHRPTLKFRPSPPLVTGLIAAGALLLPAIAPPPTDATGPSYPGETLSLTQTSPAVVGVAANFEASGQQTDIEGFAGGFDLEVFDKPPSIDPTCAPTYLGENNTWGSDLANELHPVVGLYEGSGMSFSVPFKIVPERVGPILVCAYSDWATDTAAAAPPLTVEVTAAPSSSTSPGSGSSPGSGVTNSGPSSGSPTQPTDTSKPHVTRSGKKLTCSLGAWLGAPTTYTYSWMLNGRRQNRDHSRILRISHKLRGHSVQCSVTASNAAGQATAVSSPYHVH